ncbi:MAG: 50S ribosomal protein L7/L12 [Deltaproteobacteria bacterium]|nr:50S ribosomal protein L7/L12 [Deltaproteobacteria bacterium]
MSEVTVEQVKDFIKGMSLMQAANLVKDLEAELGVSAAAPVGIVAAVGGAGGAAGGAEVEEKTEFDVILSDVGADKIKVIKVVREITSLGLKEAKELVDNAPKPLKEGASKQESASIKEKLEAVGAKVEIK